MCVCVCVCVVCVYVCGRVLVSGSMSLRRFVMRITHFWRVYALIIVGVIMFAYIVYIAKTDPYLRNSFPYNRAMGSGDFFYSVSDAEKIKATMVKNVLDYEFSRANAKYCSLGVDRSDPSAAGGNDMLDLKEDYMLLNELDESALAKANEANLSAASQLLADRGKLDMIMLSIGQVGNFRHRAAIRQTWAKSLATFNVKIAFVVGNAVMDLSAAAASANGNASATVNEQKNTGEEEKFAMDQEAKLAKEAKEHNDIVQINMPDNPNHTVRIQSS